MNDRNIFIVQNSELQTCGRMSLVDKFKEINILTDTSVHTALFFKFFFFLMVIFPP